MDSSEDSHKIPAQPADWFLQFLISHVNETKFEFGVTLQMGGLLVTGFLVAGDQYFEGFANQFTGMISNADAAASYRNAFAEAGKTYTEPAAENAAPPQYIHLRDARFFNTKGEPIVATGVWWRGRTSQIDGYVLGSLSVSEQS
jgi:hypothetical protein